MAKKASVFKKYSTEFKISCIMDVRINHFGYIEACRKFFNTPRGKEINDINILKLWERKS